MTNRGSDEQAFHYGLSCGHVEAYTEAVMIIEGIVDSIDEPTSRVSDAVYRLRVALEKSAQRKNAFPRESVDTTQYG